MFLTEKADTESTTSDKDGWEVYRIDDYASARAHGKGANWKFCGNYSGMGSNGERYFNELKARGVQTLYFLISDDGDMWCYLYYGTKYDDRARIGDVIFIGKDGTEYMSSQIDDDSLPIADAVVCSLPGMEDYIS